MTRQRLLVVLAPALVIGSIEALSDTLLDPVLPFPGDAILVTLAVLLLSLTLSRIAYRRIDVLRATVATRNRELERRAASASALRRVSVAITALVDLREVLQAIVDNARSLLGADVAVLLLHAPDGELRLAASSGPAKLIHADGAAGTEPASDVLRFVVPDAARGRLEAPLQRGPETIGVLAIGTREPRSFDPDAIETLASLATQASIAIEKARLQARLRELAVETERERIAREMHDGLAQVLGYVSTKSQAVEELLATNRVADARGQLRQLDSAARSIYVDVREAILGLRNPIRPELGLAGAIEDYAAQFADASKVGVEVEASPEAARTTLPPDVEANVFRIVQESLTNARKHSGGRRIVIRLDVVRDSLRVEVADDGRGFEGLSGDAADWPRYGLVAMRERASEIGGRIEWATDPGGGGIVRLAVPIRPADAVAAT